MNSVNPRQRDDIRVTVRGRVIFAAPVDHIHHAREFVARMVDPHRITFRTTDIYLAYRAGRAA